MRCLLIAGLAHQVVGKPMSEASWSAPLPRILRRWAGEPNLRSVSRYSVLRDERASSCYM